MPPIKKKEKVFGQAPFSLEAADLASAQSLGLLRNEVIVQQSDPSRQDYGVAFFNCDNVGVEYHESQRAIQTRCKEFAQSCGFQLLVESFSSKRNGVGNAKYVCKKLNGQPFFDNEVSLEDVVCPFSFNVCGNEGFWKVTRVNFCHNHVRQVGFSSRPVAEGSIPRPVKDKRNTTQNLLEIRRLIEVEMLPMYEGKTERMTGVAISDLLIGRGFKLSTSAISRIKLTIEAANAAERLTSYQKLESYFTLMAEKNPGSIWKFEKQIDGTFKRALFESLG
ncbi:hypothetical protein PHMEG_00013391 [Phytophthora megakarya]|uniref:Uncharacterized protein n=1 Tax=Phytophthora megakarya TaxID=4795 RepID=A0A225W8H4_9STRA|nr:hypothetical protein PHMEG_00013391 [Phytophthora megakarya]